MYAASPARYSTLPYHRCGKSGLMLPAVSLGFWHNFGDTGRYETMKQLCFTAFDHGITHFDLANNYGPEPGSAEKNLGRILHENFMPYRDELIISTPLVSMLRSMLAAYTALFGSPNRPTM